MSAWTGAEVVHLRVRAWERPTVEVVKSTVLALEKSYFPQKVHAGRQILQRGEAGLTARPSAYHTAMNQQRTRVTIDREYEAKLDSKRRILLRKPSKNEPELHDHYLVRHRDDGVIELRPQVMVDVASVSEATLHMIDQAMEHLKEGIAGDPVDLDEDFPDF